MFIYDIEVLPDGTVTLKEELDSFKDTQVTIRKFPSLRIAIAHYEAVERVTRKGSYCNDDCCYAVNKLHEFQRLQHKETTNA